jgi:DNA-binding beta-propeller fold protein YncE
MDAEALSEEEREKRLFGDQFGDSPVPVGILIEPDGSQAWVANTNADQLTLIDLGTLEISKRMRMPGEPDGMAWSPFPER